MNHPHHHRRQEEQSTPRQTQSPAPSTDDDRIDWPDPSPLADWWARVMFGAHPSTRDTAGRNMPCTERCDRAHQP
ncbi:hypothetical protein AZG88_33005 [Rhodococcus sp. LB1]|nr:hypothetical protein AZG88_33005 [Rhodococcus sp. LB1]